MASDGKLSKLKAKLAEISTQIDNADVRKSDAKASMIEASSRLEKAESEVHSINRRIKLLEKDLEDVNGRCDQLENKLEDVTHNCSSIEEARKQLEEHENAGDEKIQQLEEEVKESRRKHEENQTKLTEAERKRVVVKRDLERTRAKADALEKRVEVLGDTMTTAANNLKELEEREGESSMKEEQNTDQILLLQGQYKEAEVRAEAAERSCNVLERNITEAEGEIESWRKKTEEIDEEMESMNNVSDDSGDEE